MERKITIEGGMSKVTLSNVGMLENYNIDIENINEESEIQSIMEKVDAYAQSGELNVVTNECSYNVMNAENVKYLATSDGREISMDSFTLVNKTMDELKTLLQHANVGDVIYLRREKGKANITLSLELQKSDEAMNLSYFDCSVGMDQYDLLRDSYYDVVCDTFLPESLSTKENQATVENFVFEPEIVYGEIYRIVENGGGIKTLKKIEFPGYYFQNEQREIDE